MTVISVVYPRCLFDTDIVVISVPPGVYNVRVTAYAKGDKTALGTTPIPGKTVAVSRDLLHLLGKRVYVSGYGVFKVEDLMNERFERRIDLFSRSVEKAIDFGIRDTVIVPLDDK